jgi:hypothetical protein
LVLVVDPALGKQPVAHGVHQHALDFGRSAVALETLADQQRTALRPGHDVDDGEQFSIGAPRDLGQDAERGGLAPVVAGERVAAEIMQREVVMIAGGERRTVAGEPGARVAADGQSRAFNRGLVLDLRPVICHRCPLADRCHP